MRKVFAIGLITLFSFAACTTYRPHNIIASENDYNNRKIVTSPQYKKKLNVMGHASNMVGLFGGAYVGYNSNLITYNNSDHNQTSNKYINSALGAIVGFGLSSLANHILFNQGKKRYVQKNEQDIHKWIRKYNKDYIPISFNGSSLDIIRKDSRSKDNYTVKNYSDIEDYSNAFSYNKELDQIIVRDYKSMGFNDKLKSFSYTYKKYGFEAKSAIRQSLLQDTRTLKHYYQIDTASNDMPNEFRSALKSNALGLVNQEYGIISDFDEFYSAFPGSSWIPDLLDEYIQSYPKEMSRLGVIFDKHIVTNSTFSTSFYVYVPPQHIGIFAINGTEKYDLDYDILYKTTKYISSEPLYYRTDFVQLIHSTKILGFRINPIAVNFSFPDIINSSSDSNFGNLYRFEFDKNSTPSLFCGYSINPFDAERYGKAFAIDYVKSELINSFKSNSKVFSKINSSVSKLKASINIWNFVSGNDAVARDALIELFCQYNDCNEAVELLMKDFFRHFHIRY